MSPSDRDRTPDDRQGDDATDSTGNEAQAAGRGDGRARDGEQDDGERRGGSGERRGSAGRDGDDTDAKGDRDREADQKGDRKRKQANKDGKKDGSEESDDGENESEDDEEKAAERRSKRRPYVIAGAVIVVVLALLGGLYYWLSTRGTASTDDAYTDGNIVNIAPQVAGQVVSLDVTDNQFVRKGDPLIHIDKRQYVYSQEQAQGQVDSTKARIASQQLAVEIARKNFPASLELARANLDQAKAGQALQRANYARQKALPKLATTQQEVDTTAANYQQAQAQVEQAQARVTQAEPVKQNIGQTQEQVSQLQGELEQAQGRLDQAKLNVEWSVVLAPQDGWVTRRNVNKGDYLQAGQQIMAIVTTDQWITANFKETELDGMKPGQKTTITVDAFPDLTLHGHVDSIQRGSGSKFSAFPPENATGNFIKIVQRVPVKILIDSGLLDGRTLPLGISVIPTVTVQ